MKVIIKMTLFGIIKLELQQERSSTEHTELNMHTNSWIHEPGDISACMWPAHEQTARGSRETGWLTYFHAVPGQSAMKAFPFVIKCSLSEEQSLGESTTLSLRCRNSLAKTNERGGNCRQTKITFPIKVPASSGSQKPPVLLYFLTALISPLISLPVEKPHERGYESSKQLI